MHIQVRAYAMTCPMHVIQAYIPQELPSQRV